MAQSRPTTWGQQHDAIITLAVVTKWLRIGSRSFLRIIDKCSNSYKFDDEIRKESSWTGSDNCGVIMNLHMNIARLFDITAGANIVLLFIDSWQLNYIRFYYLLYISHVNFLYNSAHISV